MDPNADTILAALILFHAATIVIADSGRACWHVHSPIRKSWLEPSIKVCIQRNPARSPRRSRLATAAWPKVTGAETQIGYRAEPAKTRARVLNFKCIVFSKLL